MASPQQPPFTWQLDGDAFQLDLRQAVRPRRELTSDGLTGAASAAVPSVLLISRAADAEAEIVRRLLTAIGVPAVRIDADTVPQAGLVIDLARQAVRVYGRWVRPTVAWLRHYSPRAMPMAGGQVRQIFTADSWQALADQLGALAAVSLTAPGPGLLTQLTLARRHQITIPATVVTANLATAAELLGGQRVIIKALHQHFAEASPGLLTGVFPEIIERAELTGESGGPPVVVQEYLEHDCELRVYVTPGQVIAFEITKSSPAQPWREPARVRATQIDPPPAVAIAARALAAGLAIQYGAIDFLVVNGDPVFLEVNLNGDWHWLEAKLAATPVTDAVVTMLRDLHISATAGSAGLAADPISFLSGGRLHPG